MELTSGVAVTLPAACTYTFTTPNETTAPTADDGFQSPTPAVRDVHLSWVGDPQTTMVITWATDFATTATTAFVDGKPTPGFSFAYPTDLGGADPPSVRIHQVHLCGLTPGSSHAYTVQNVNGQFTTAPAAAQSLKVLVAGDSRGNAATWGSVFVAGAGEAPDFALFTGDANDLGTIQDDWEAWFAAMATVAPDLPLLLAHGNHEINARHYYSQFPMPGNQQWYDFDYGDAHFVVLNDTPADTSVIAGAEKTFLDQSLAATTKTWKIVVHHKPPYTASTVHGPELTLQAAWSPVYEAHGVDLVLNGHAHSYERSKPIVAGQPAATGPVYIVEGGGGADPYDVAPAAFTAFPTAMVTGAQYGYVTVAIAGRTLTLTAKKLDGSVLDTFSITK
jgi:Calcineurin-like phosphoesterase/Purple acid Phosphatase, N-terminal domain